MTIAAIMQPTFLPWLGYFALIDQVDHFIFLDDVQLAKQSWQTRNRIKGPNGPIMLSLPISRKLSKPQIADARLSNEASAASLFRTLDAVLGKAPHYHLVQAIIARAFADADGRLGLLNIGVIEQMAQSAGLETVFHRAGELRVEGARSERLALMCRKVGAHTYISPPGSLDYLQADGAFEGSGIKLRFQRFEHPEYPQDHPPFLSHMAAVECFAALGPDGFREKLREGARAPATMNELQEAAP